MKLSIITPVHKTSAPYLEAAHFSLMTQELRGVEWEWIICPNNGGEVISPIANDGRVKIFPISDDEIEKYNSIGRLKAYACSKATGDVLIELDADDILTPDALLEIYKAFEDPEIMFAYSNSAAFQSETWEPKNVYSEYYGWKSRPFTYDGHDLVEMIAWPPAAQSIRRIEWAPNHVRCWRKSAYDALGGHDPEIKAGDDHDLVCRTYIKYGSKGMKHIDKCLYIYRVHETNSCVIYNDDVQVQTDQNYLKYSRQMANVWADDNKLTKLNLGGRINQIPGYTSVDLFDADEIMDLDEDWPIPDNSVGVIQASHIFEHLKDPVHTMNEAYRVLAPGGWLFIDVPSTDGRGAFQDPTHVSFWNQNSIWYYTNRDFARFIQPKYKGRFQVSRVVTWFPGDHEREHDIPTVQADLICLKGDYARRPAGEILI